MPINQPSNQIKLTNVSVVRLKKGGKRFEVAAYKNKVMEWKSGIETDLDEVLQIQNVFTNVSKGQTAKSEDLIEGFGTSDRKLIIQEILKQGEQQIGEKERSHMLKNLNKDIAMIISSMTVDPSTQKPYTVSMIEKALSEMGFSAITSKNSKSQALEAIRLIKEKNIIPIARTSIRLRISCESKYVKTQKDLLRSKFEHIEEEIWEENCEIIGIIEPDKYREVTELLRAASKGKAQVECLN